MYRGTQQRTCRRGEGLRQGAQRAEHRRRKAGCAGRSRTPLPKGEGAERQQAKRDRLAAGNKKELARKPSTAKSRSCQQATKRPCGFRAKRTKPADRSFPGTLAYSADQGGQRTSLAACRRALSEVGTVAAAELLFVPLSVPPAETKGEQRSCGDRRGETERRQGDCAGQSPRSSQRRESPPAAEAEVRHGNSAAPCLSEASEARAKATGRAGTVTFRSAESSTEGKTRDRL